MIAGKFEAPNPYWKHEDFTLLEYELMVVTEGTLYLSYNGENYTVESGEYLLLPPSDGHRKGFKESYVSFYWMHFEVPESSEKMLEIAATGKLPRPEKVIVLMKSLQDMKKNSYPACAQNAMCTTIMMEIYAELQTVTASALDTRFQKQVYLDILDYIDTNIYENLKVSHVASHFGYNEKYLSHRFNQVAGMPLKQYILKKKMETAGFLLCDTNKPITEIAEKLGFSDSHNFSRAFKTVLGLSPSEYRNAYSKRLLFHK